MGREFFVSARTLIAVKLFKKSKKRGKKRARDSSDSDSDSD